MLNAQQIFDKVTFHLTKQGRKAETICPEDERFPECRYREQIKGETVMCAVGCLIPDKRYIPDMEGMGVNLLVEKYPDVFKDILDFEEHADLLKKLQEVHDRQQVKDWPDYFKQIAEKDKLKYNH